MNCYMEEARNTHTRHKQTEKKNLKHQMQWGERARPVAVWAIRYGKQLA